MKKSRSLLPANNAMGVVVSMGKWPMMIDECPEQLTTEQTAECCASSEPLLVLLRYDI